MSRIGAQADFTNHMINDTTMNTVTTWQHLNNHAGRGRSLQTNFTHPLFADGATEGGYDEFILRGYSLGGSTSIWRNLDEESLLQGTKPNLFRFKKGYAPNLDAEPTSTTFVETIYPVGSLVSLEATIHYSVLNYGPDGVIVTRSTPYSVYGMEEMYGMYNLTRSSLSTFTTNGMQTLYKVQEQFDAEHLPWKDGLRDVDTGVYLYVTPVLDATTDTYKLRFNAYYADLLANGYMEWQVVVKATYSEPNYAAFRTS